MLDKHIVNLPAHLLERVRVFQDSEGEGGQFVLYWMRTAVRADENPALDVAVTIAHELELPVLVYHGLSQHYQYASDRHHTFMLEGACDVQAQFAEHGVSYGFHLATPGDDRRHLVALAEQAAIVLTEEMPVDPPRRFLKALAEKVATPIICVDTACVVPMQLLNQSYTRAFKYRQATEQLYADRVGQPWPSQDVASKQFDLSRLPFEPVDLQFTNISDLVAQCEIDHSIGPVVDTVGGSSAGYERWNQFVEEGISKYAQRRNNALLDGVSRMSAYLHYGMVSPFRIVREAAAVKNGSAEKYLDEVLIWRELAYSFCFHRSDHDQWSALPDWAQATLETHASDPRSKVYSWEQLARAQTEDPFWNAAQMSLLMQGELHNNVRMTWGKAILNWTHSPQDALRLMIDLNHRYALDGRDPASYGGLLWCLGQFDRPFEPEAKLFGTVRPRWTDDHAQRLDTTAFRAKVTAPRFDPVPKVAVIGAGISGLFAARTLADHGLDVTVFDKGRGVGGRMSTRRLDGQPCFDHGAQYFTARDSRFRRYVDAWSEQGIVARWPDANSDKSQKIVVLENGKVTQKSDANERFVGLPAMNAVCKHLAIGVDVQTSARVDRIEQVETGIRLTGESDAALGVYDRLIVSAPAAQTAKLLTDFPLLAEPISNIQMQPCWALMVSLEQPVTQDWVGAFIHDSILTWVARNSTKPQRPCEAEHLVIHAGHPWTALNWERDADDVASEMLAAFWKAIGSPPQAPTQFQVHRWGFAIPVYPPKSRCFFDADSGIAACGDWAGGPRVEGAFLSGMAAAGRILGTLTAKQGEKTSQLRLF